MGLPKAVESFPNDSIISQQQIEFVTFGVCGNGFQCHFSPSSHIMFKGFYS